MDKLLKPEEAAEYLAMTRSNVMRLYRNGKLKGHRMGHKTVRFRLEDLEAFINKPYGD